MQATPGHGSAKPRVWLRSFAVVAALFLYLMPLCTGEGKAADDKKEKRKKCKSKHDPHGTWHGVRDLEQDYTLVCKEGYAVDGKPNVTIRCNHEGLWNGDPWCEDMDDCAKLKHGCGPGGLCVDHVGFAECLCEEGSTKRLAANGEDVCYFHGAAKNARCGNMSCGSHGVCVDLAEYQDTFDTGSTAFRCSCEEGYHDNGETCVALDCGARSDPMGTWNGNTKFGGEYTLTCNEGAFIWGGSEEAITVTCGKKGKWSNGIRCMKREQASEDAQFATFRFWTNVSLSTLCICTAALAAGLTMGLVSQEKLELYMIQKIGSEEGALKGEQDYAKQLLDIKKDHHLLLVTLLLLNAFANEALPIFLDQLVSAQCAVLLSVTLVLMFGEILPSAVMTSQRKMELVTPLIPLVKIFMLVFYPIAKPIAVLLDSVLAEDDEDLYTRAELRAVLRMHCGQYLQPEVTQPSATSPMVRDGSLSSHNRQLLDLCSEQTMLTERARGAPPLDPLEGELFARVMDMGETKVLDSRGFRPISGRRKKCCHTDFMAAEVTAFVLEKAVAAIAAGKEGIVVFQSEDELEDWPNSVQMPNTLSVVRVVDLLHLDSKTRLQDLDLKKCIDIDKDSPVTDTLCLLGDDNNPQGFAIVTDAGEFLGLLDGQDAVLGFTPGSKQIHSDSQPVKQRSQRDVSQPTTAKLVAEKLKLPLPPAKGEERKSVKDLDFEGSKSQSVAPFGQGRRVLRKNSAPPFTLRMPSKDEEDVFELRSDRDLLSPVLTPQVLTSTSQTVASFSSGLRQPEAGITKYTNSAPNLPTEVKAEPAKELSSAGAAEGLAPVAEVPNVTSVASSDAVTVEANSSAGGAAPPAAEAADSQATGAATAAAEGEAEPAPAQTLDQAPAGSAAAAPASKALPGFAETPAAETPAPEAPAPETPAPETPAPETPAPETPATASPAPASAETPATGPAETPAPGPAETPAPGPLETPAPESAEAPARAAQESTLPGSAETPAQGSAGDGGTEDW